MKHDPTLFLLPDIYNSALHPEAWGATLDKITDSVGAKGAMLIIVDQDDESGLAINHFSTLWADSHSIIGDYNEKYFQYEKSGYDKMYATPKQTILLDTEVWANEPDLINRPDYVYLREKVGIVRRLAARLNDNMSWWDSLTIHLDEKHETIPDYTITATAQLLAHAAKSVELSRTFNLLRSNYNAVLSALDHVEIGLCIALRDGEVIVRNTEADRILEERDGLTITGDGKLNSLFPDQDAQLKQAIATASDTAQGENSSHELFMVTPRRSGGESLLVEISPLTDHTRELDAGMAGALITLIDPLNSKPFSVSRTATAYKLSPVESEVCRLLVEGLSTQAMADTRNVSPETIRTQIKSVLQKTGCARRSELIRLALKTSPPVAVPVGKPDTPKKS